MSQSAVASRQAAQREKERLKKAQRDKEQAKKQADREKERLKAQHDKEQAKKQADREKERLKKAQRDKEQAKKQADREKERLNAQREKERLKAQREKEQAKKQADRERAELKAKADRERERTKAAEQARRDKEREEREQKLTEQRTRQQLDKQRLEAERQKQRDQEAEERKREQDRLRSEREEKKQQELARKEAEREGLRLAREEELARQKAARDSEKETQRLAKEEERQRQKAEREAEKQRVREERDAERERKREEVRRKREEDRALREAEQAAYRKAKEAEQAKIRSEREAARKALEGRVARASGRANRSGGARATTTTRVYSPASIPDQSGTRRDMSPEQAARFANLRPTPPPSEPAARSAPRTLPPPPPPPEVPPSVEERYALVVERLRGSNEDFRNEYEENFLMSWIHHDSALEGVVYTYEELRTAVNPNITVVPDSSLQSVCDEIRRHKAAIEFVRDYGERKRAPVTLDHLKRIYLILHPEEGDLKTVRYRKDVPQHRMYFHEYAAPDKIPYKVRQIFDWLNGPEPKKLKSALRIAAKVHYDLLRVFPFAKDSGKVVRLFMNMLLLRADYPPAILHSTERQRYYEALKGSPTVLHAMLQAAIMNALQSIEKKLDERETRLRAIIS